MLTRLTTEPSRPRFSVHERGALVGETTQRGSVEDLGRETYNRGLRYASDVDSTFA